MKHMRPELKCTAQVFRYDIFGRKATTDTNLVETLQRLLQYNQDQERNYGLFDVIAKVASETLRFPAFFALSSLWDF